MSDVNFTFSGDASDLRKALDEIKQEVSRTAESASKMSTQFVAAFAAVQGAVMAAKAAFSWFAAIPQQAARLEDLQVKFTSLMGDAEAAGKLMSDLWQDAANGAVPLEGLADAARPLTTIFSDSASIREWTLRFADIATGSGMAADQLAKMYARAVQLGTVDSRAVESLAKQGVPIYRELGAVIGVATDKVKELVSKGSVSASQYAAALRRMTDAGGAYYQLSSKMSNTSAGSWDTLTESVNILMATLGKPINDAIRPLLQDIASALQDSLPQVQAFGESLVAAFSGAVEVVAPVIGGIGELVSMLGGAKTVLASVAAAMLLYAGHTKAAAAQSVSLRTQVGGLAAALRGLSIASVASGFKSALASMRSALASTLVGMRVAWSVAWSTMAAITRAAMIAVKSAIISTGIGLIIVGIGEALGALYSWFSGNADAAKEAAAANREFVQSLRALEKSASQVKTKEQYNDFMNSLNERINDLFMQKNDAARAGDKEEYAKLMEQLKKLMELRSHYKKTLPAQVAAAEAAEREAAAIREQREQAEELAKKLKETQENLANARKEQEAKMREDYLSSLDTETQITLRLSDAGGFKTLEELKAAMDELASRSFSELGDDEKYKRMAETYNTIVKLRKEAAKEAEKEAKEKQKELDRAKKEREEAELDYHQKLAMLQAERTQDERRIELLRREQKIVQLTAEYRKQGLEDAAALAQQMVEAELSAEIAKERREQKERNKQGASRMSGTWVQDSRASVGGGGVSFLIGGPMLSESKKHTTLLREVREEIRKQKPEVKVSGNVTAVLGA